MSIIGTIGNIPSTLLQRQAGVGGADGATTPVPLRLDSPAGSPATTTTPADFGNVFDQMIKAVDAKQAHAQEVTRSVLTGQNNQLHQSVIAMQEAGVSFQLMVEVRNKLVESYQELMRMQA